MIFDKLISLHNYSTINGKVVMLKKTTHKLEECGKNEKQTINLPGNEIFILTMEKTESSLSQKQCTVNNYI